MPSCGTLSSLLVQRLRKGLTAVFAGQVVVIAGNLVMVPVYLTYWSPTQYGEWLTLFSLLSYLYTLDPGVSQAMVNRLTQAYARKDLEEYADYQHSALAFYLLLAAGGSLALVVSSRIVPISWLGLSETAPSIARWVILWLGLHVLWSIPAGFVTAVYRTNGNFAVSQWLSNSRRVLGFLLVAAVLMGGGGMHDVAAFQIVPLGIAVFALWDVRRRFPELLSGVSRASWKKFSDLLWPGLSFSLILVANALQHQGSVILIATAMGGAAVAVFATLRTMANLTRQCVGAVGTVLWPELTALEARSERESLRRTHRVMVAVASSLSIAIASVLWFYGGELLALWTNQKLDADIVLLRLLLLQLVLQTPWIASSVVSRAANRHAAQARLHLIGSILGLATAGVLMSWIGVWAVPIGFILGEAVCCYHWVIKDSCQMVGEDYARFALRLWPGTAAVFGSTLIAVWLAVQAFDGPLFLRGFVSTVAGVGTIAVVAPQVLLHRSDRFLVGQVLLMFFPVVGRFLAPGKRVAAAK